LAEMLGLKPGDEKRLHPDALKWFKDQRATIQREVPLEELSDDDLNTFLSDDEKREFIRCKDEIARGLVRCMDTGDGASTSPVTDATIGLTVLRFKVESLSPIHKIGLLLKNVYEHKVAKAKEEQTKREEEERKRQEQAQAEKKRREEEAEAERREKEEEERWRAARKAVNPSINDAKRYLDKPGEYDKFIEAAREAIEVYMEKREDYLDDSRTFDYRTSLWKINYRKEEERQKIAANFAAKEYNRELNKEIVNLKSKLDPQRKNLSTYFQLKIKDKRHTGHKFDYVLSKEEEENFDRTLVRIANERLKQLIPNSLSQFIDIPSQYYRIYFPLPSVSYSFAGVPCLDFAFDIFAAAYGEVWLKPGKKSFGDYEFHLPRIEEGNYSVLLQEPKLLGYYYLVLKPEELGGYSFWQSIPLVLLRGLLSGETKPNGVTISEALDDSVTYKIPKFKEEVNIPDNFASYLRSIGSIDQMLSIGMMIEKVASIAKSELDELKVKHVASPLDKMKGENSKKAKVFKLFSEGKRPSDPEVKSLGIKPESAYRYYQAWKKASYIR